MLNFLLNRLAQLGNSQLPFYLANKQHERDVGAPMAGYWVLQRQTLGMVDVGLYFRYSQNHEAYQLVYYQDIAQR